MKGCGGWCGRRRFYGTLRRRRSGDEDCFRLFFRPFFLRLLRINNAGCKLLDHGSDCLLLVLLHLERPAEIIIGFRLMRRKVKELERIIRHWLFVCCW